MPRPKSDRQASRLTVTLDADAYAKVCVLANQNDVSAAWIIRRAVDNYLQSTRPNPPTGAAASRRAGGQV